MGIEALRRQLQRLPLPANPGGLVYGTILIATLLAAESATAETYLETIVGIALSEFVYWLALSYSEFAGERAKGDGEFELKGLWREGQHELAVVFGGIPPTLVVVGCWIGGVGLELGQELGVYSAALMIVVVELTIGLRASKQGRELAFNALAGVVLGVLVIVLRLILH